MTVQARELSVTYGSFSLSTANGCYLQGLNQRYRLRRAYPEGFFSCEFEVVLASPTGVTATDNASFKSLCDAVEAALRKPDQRLQVSLGASSLADVNPSSSARSGYKIRGECEKIGSDDSGRVRRYAFTCTFRLLADLSGANNRVPEASTEAQSSIGGRRTLIAQGSWTAATTTTALESYNTNGDTYFATVLPTPVTNGEWVLVDSNPRYDNQNTELLVTRVYWEVVNGLRDYEVTVEIGPNQAKRITVSGQYTKTSGATATANHDANVGTLVTSVMTANGVTAYDAKPVARQDRYDTTTERYFFSRTHEELIYPQSSSTDDASVVAFSLVVTSLTPINPRTVLSSTRVQQLREAQAVYTAEIDKSVTTDLNTLWTSTLRPHALNAIATKLGATGTTLQDSRLSLDLPNNRITAFLSVIVLGGNVLSLVLSESVDRVGSANPVPRAVKRPHSYFLFERPPAKRLSRVATVEFLAGSQIPVVFAPGEQASGFDLVNTGKTIMEALDELETGVPFAAPGWLAIDGGRRFSPVTRGENEDLSTVVMVQTEEWLYVAELERAPVGGAAGGGASVSQ